MGIPIIPTMQFREFCVPFFGESSINKLTPLQLMDVMISTGRNSYFEQSLLTKDIRTYDHKDTNLSNV